MSSVFFNSIFKACNQTHKRYRVMLGSAGSGKSVNVAQDYIIKLSDPHYKGCSLLVIRSAEATHYHSTYAELLSVIHKLGLGHIWDCKTRPHLQMKCKVTGNSIVFRGCNDESARERLKSVTVSEGKICWIWVEEATEIKKSDFEILDDRLRGELPPNLYYQITLTFNPVNSEHWIKKDLWDYKDSNTFTHKSTYLDNKFIDEAYKERMKRRKELDPQGYEIYGLGNWGELDGIVFTNVEYNDYSNMSFDMYTLGADWGFNHATAILLIGWRNEEPYVLKEVYEFNKTTKQIIQKCDELNIPKRYIMYCDSAEPDRIKEFREAGYRAEAVKKEPNSVSNQINWLKDRIIHIDVACTNTIKEIKNYRYQKDKNGNATDQPISVEDDAIASLRYGIEPVRKAQRLHTMKKGALGL